MGRLVNLPELTTEDIKRHVKGKFIPSIYKDALDLELKEFNMAKKKRKKRR